MSTTNTPLLLLVEDEAIIAMQEAQELTRAGFEVIHAVSGEEALGIISGGGRKIDLVLMDINLGEGPNGIATAHEILSRIDIPILFLSSHFPEDFCRKTEAILHYGCIQKSSSAEILTASIKAAINISASRIPLKDAESRLNLEKELAEKNSLLDSIIESCPDVIVFALDKNYRYIAFNTNHRNTMKHIWGKDIAAGQNMLDAIGSDSDRMRAKENFDKALSGKHFVLEEEYGDEKLARLFWLDYYSPLIAPDGSIIGLSCFVINHTKQRQAELQVENLLSEKELLLREVHHRIKNNMTIVFSLLRLQSSKQHNEDARSAINDAANRIQSMMVLYEKLYRSESLNCLSLKLYLETLINEIGASYIKSSNIEINSTIEDVSLSASELSHIGIVLNELFTNSIKHAFSGREKGTISILARKEDHTLFLEYRDDGIGMKPTPDAEADSDGMGMQLIKILAAQMKAGLTIAAENGFKASLSMPLA